MLRSNKIRAGLTLVELMVVVLIVTFLMIAVGATMVDAQSAWTRMYNRSNSGPTLEGVIATKEFDRAIRKATKSQVDIDSTVNAPSGTVGTQMLRVYYFKQPDPGVTPYSTNVDGYTEFRVVGTDLVLYEGNAAYATTYSTSGSPTATRTIAHDVQGCRFSVQGNAVAMMLRLDSGTNTDAKDGNVKMTVTCSAMRHN